MYSYANDPGAALVVGIWSGSTATADDYDASLQSVSRNDRDGIDRGVTAISVMIIGSDVPTPNALDRKRIADEWAAGRGNHVYIMVTSSRVVRGVLTAIEWFTPSTARRQQIAAATFEDAMKAVESKRPGTSRRLRELLDEAQRKSRAIKGS
jgi:hypothetical protein